MTLDSAADPQVLSRVGDLMREAIEVWMHIYTKSPALIHSHIQPETFDITCQSVKPP